MLDGDKFVAELFGLSLEFSFQPFLPLRVFGGPHCFVVFDLVSDHRVKDHCNFVCGRRNRRAWAQFGFHAAEVSAHWSEAVMEGRSGQTE